LRHSPRLLLAYIPILFLLLASCDKADGPTNILQEDPVLSNLHITPSALTFTEEDGVRDTLVTFEVSVRSRRPDDYTLVAVLASAEDRTLIDSDTLLLSSTRPPSFYRGSLAAALQTTDQRNLVLYVYVSGSPSGISNRVESVIKVRGTSSGFPLVLRSDHPDTVFIPSPGNTTTFSINADVSHSVSLALIDRVWLELIDQDNRNLYRNTMDEADSGSDEFRRFTEGFSLDSGNNPDSISVRIYAEDIAGTVSDTLRSHFIIAR
jgi:hypothetical protein